MDFLYVLFVSQASPVARLVSLVEDRLDLSLFVGFTGEMRENFQQEVGIMKELDHPNICTVYESYDHGRHVYLVMEYCAGLEHVFFFRDSHEQMRIWARLGELCA